MTAALLLLLLAGCPGPAAFTPIASQGAKVSSTGSGGRARTLASSSGGGEFGGMVGSSFVMLGGDGRLSGSKLDLLKPVWQVVPPIERGPWKVGGGLADKDLVVGKKLLAAWWRGEFPIHVAVYDPEKNAWSFPANATPPTAFYANELALQDWWLAASQDGKSVFRFNVSTLKWARVKPGPLADFSLVAASAPMGNTVAFFSAAGGAIYDADADAWTPVAPGGPANPYLAHASPRTGRIAVLQAQQSGGWGTGGAVYDLAKRTWTKISGAEELGATASPSGAGPYVVSFYNPGDPIWLLDPDAARWRRVPEAPGVLPRPPLQLDPGPAGGPMRHPPRPLLQPKLLLAGDETLFLENPDCLGEACLATGHVGGARTLHLYDAAARRWCAVELPAGVSEALGSLEYFQYEQVWRNHLLLWSAARSQDGNSGGMPWTAERTRITSAARGGVVAW